MYRGHDAFLFTSRYEAWGMPVLEAMASGLAVVATRCLGVESFAQHGVNSLLADPQVPQPCPQKHTHRPVYAADTCTFPIIWSAVNPPNSCMTCFKAM